MGDKGVEATRAAVDQRGGEDKRWSGEIWLSVVVSQAKAAPLRGVWKTGDGSWWDLNQLGFVGMALWGR